MAQWIVRGTWDRKVESSSPGRCTHVVFVGKTLNSPPRCINENQQIAWGWTSIPSRGSRNTPSRFILQKLEISAGTDEPSGSPNYDWGRLYLLHKQNSKRTIKQQIVRSLTL